MVRTDEKRGWRGQRRRLFGALIGAAALALGVYILLGSVRAGDGLVSFTFLLILPAAICAFIAYVADPWAERSRHAYRMIPVWVTLAVMVVSIAFLQEGTICILILSPLWLLSGLAGTSLTYRIRQRLDDGRRYCVALLTAPLLAMQVEPMLPIPEARESVVRSAVVAAPPERIWPLLRGMHDIRPGEGRWTFSQNIVGLPRPLDARLIGDGVGAERLASWGGRIRFRERITEWRLHRRIGWRFLFDDVSAWQFTDRHLMPNSAYFRITDGGYTVEPIDAGHSRVTIDTHYRVRTPVNAYSALWGEVFLGDVENNLLALIQQRAVGRG